MDEQTRDEILIALDKLNENQVATNNSINELNHYIIEKDKKEEKEKANAEKEAKEIAEKEAEETENKNKEQEKRELTKSQQEQEQQEIYQEQIHILSDGISTQNGMIAGQFVTDGIIAGVLLLTILWNKLQ